MIPYGPITEFHLGPITIQAWGLMVALGFMVGILLILWQVKQAGFKTEKILDLVLWVFIASMVGARVFYVIVFWQDFAGQWLEALKIWNGGMVFYGGLLFAIAVFIWFARRHRMNIWRLSDWAAPALALGTAIGRVGCHLIQDHPGKITTFPLAIMVNGELRHETALYLVFSNLIIFSFLWLWLRKSQKLPVGALFYIYLIWEGITRFVIDFFRADDLLGADPRYWGLTVSQYIGIGLVVAGVMVWGYLYKRRPSAPLFLDKGSQDHAA